MVYANDSNCDGPTPRPSFKVTRLSAQVIHGAINLLDHRLVYDFAFCANLDCRNDATSDFIISGENHRLTRHQLAKGSIPTPSLHSMSLIANIDYALMAFDPLN